MPSSKTKPQAPSLPTRPAMGQVSDMDLRLLQIFEVMVSCGGINAAARELNLGVPTLSRALKDLETRLGLVLCQRGRAGFALTPEGVRVHEQAQRLLHAVEDFRVSVHDIHARMEGNLSLALFDKMVSNPHSRLAQALAHFRLAAPAVHLHVHVCAIAQMEQAVADGRYAMGVLPIYRELSNLRYAHLFTERMNLYCGPGHRLFGHTGPLSWAQVKDHAFAGLGYQSPNMNWSHRHQLERSATAYDQEAIVALILSGQFLGFLPDHYAERFVQNGQLFALHPETLFYECPFALMWREPLGRAAQHLLDCIQAQHASV